MKDAPKPSEPADAWPLIETPAPAPEPAMEPLNLPHHDRKFWI